MVSRPARPSTGQDTVGGGCCGLGHGLDNTFCINSCLRFVIFPMFRNDEYTGYLYDKKFIFDRCLHSWAAETPDKYEHDCKYLTCTFA